MTAPTLSLRTRALGVRIYGYASPRGWDCTFAEVAEALGVSVARVRATAQQHGWLTRFRHTRPSDEWGAKAAFSKRTIATHDLGRIIG